MRTASSHIASQVNYAARHMSVSSLSATLALGISHKPLERGRRKKHGLKERRNLIENRAKLKPVRV